MYVILGVMKHEMKYLIWNKTADDRKKYCFLTVSFHIFLVPVLISDLLNKATKMYEVVKIGI